MNKTLNINLAGFIFHIDEDAYQELEGYLTKIKAQFVNTEGGEEIIQDIESRIAELFRLRISEAKEVINKEDVAEVIGIMGKPEDYLEADDYEGAKQQKQEREQAYFQRSSRIIYRDADNRIIGGVAAGLAHYFKIDPLWVRLLFVALFFAGFGTLVYIILWIVVPKANTTVEKLQMRGERVNISNIEKSIREEMDALGGKMRGFAAKAKAHDYQQYSQKTGGFFSDLGNFIGMAVRTIFKVLGKVIGFLLILFAFVVLVGIIAGLLTGGFHVLGNNMGFWSLMDFLELVTVDALHFNSLAVGLLLITIAPLFLFIYLGLRLLFDLEPLNKSARNGILISILAGFIILIIAGSRIGISLDSHGSYSERFDLDPYTDTLHIEVNEDAVYQAFEAYNFNPHWMVIDERNIFGDVDLTVYKSNDSNNFILTEIHSRGNNRREARAFAKELQYSFQQTDSLLEFDHYYTLDTDSRYRGQEVHHKLYIRVGTKIYLHENTIDLIYDIKNIGNVWDHDMVNHWWEMTDKGLLCLDCLEQQEPVWPGDEEADDAENFPDTEQEEEPDEKEDMEFSTTSLQFSKPSLDHVAHLVLHKTVQAIL